jgi:hypothetical protein
MKLLNATKMAAGYTLGLDKGGRESIVVAVKGTFLIPSSPLSEPKLAAEQAPLVMADVYTGEPGFSAPLYESDYAPRKPRCDVLLNGSAYAPGGRAVERVTVTLRVGGLTKAFDVVGKRTWGGSLVGWKASPIQPFMVQPISYNVAFGGTDRSNPDPSKHKAYPLNPFGIGYHDTLDAKAIEGKPLPNTEERGKSISSPTGKYVPMAFGPIARVFPERVKYAGTYDKKWLDDVSPFLPADFQDEYFQAAPPDQQMDYLQGGEEVELLNLTPQGRTGFKLPTRNVPLEFSLRDGTRQEMQAVIDTLTLEPDLERFTMVWRVNLPLRRNIFEVKGSVAGKLSPGWYRARASGKTYYPSLHELALSRKGGT